MINQVLQLTMQQALDDFLIYKSATCVEKTIEYYRSNIGSFLKWYSDKTSKKIDKVMLDEVTNKVLNEYLIYLRDRNAFDGHPIHGGLKDEKLSNNTIRTYQRALRVFLKYCYEEDYIQTDISKKFKFIRETQSIVLPLYESEANDIDSLFNPKCKQGIRNLCIVHLMLDAGLRSGEVIRLKVGDIDFNKNIIFIKDSKFDKNRMIPMGTKLKTMLHKYLIVYRGVSENQSYNMDLKADPFFLEVKSNKPITGDVVRCLFSRIKRNTKISRIYPHLLRHTFATSYILGGGNLESLRILMGHSDIVTTQKYVHLAHTYQLMHPDVYKLDKVFFKTYY